MSKTMKMKIIQTFEMSSRSLIVYGDKVETFDPYYRSYTTFINFKKNYNIKLFLKPTGF